MIEDVQHAINLLVSERDSSSQIAMVIRASKCSTCSGKFSCADENGNYAHDYLLGALNCNVRYHPPCPYGVEFKNCVIMAADPSDKDYSMGRNLIKAAESNGLDDISRLSFTLNLYENRKKKGLGTNEVEMTDARAKLLWLLVQYKAALEIQFEDFIEEENAITI